MQPRSLTIAQLDRSAARHGGVTFRGGGGGGAGGGSFGGVGPHVLADELERSHVVEDALEGLQSDSSQ